jgi:hypothetical protein
MHDSSLRKGCFAELPPPKGDVMEGAPLPPGETGLLLLGETLTLLKNGFAF